MQKSKQKNQFAKKCSRKTTVYNVESEEEFEETSVVRIQDTSCKRQGCLCNYDRSDSKLIVVQA